MIDSVRLTISDFDMFKLNMDLIKEKNISKKNSIRIIKYKNCELQIYSNSDNYMLLICNAHTILNKKDIYVSDLKEFERRIKAILNDIILDGNYSISVNRIDFYSDVFVQDDYTFKLYMKLLQKHRNNFMYCKSKALYKTSKHISTGGSGSKNFNLYDKYEERKKGITGEELEKWKNCIRIELQYKKMYFKNQYKKYGVLPILDNYWNFDSYKSMYLNVYDKYLYWPSRYYKLSVAKNIVNSSDLTWTLKKNINKFLSVVNIVGMEDITKYYNRNTIDKFSQILVKELGVCPITLNDNEKYESLENLFELAKQSIKDKSYFN